MGLNKETGEKKKICGRDFHKFDTVLFLFTSELPIRSIRNPSNHVINEEGRGGEQTTKDIGGAFTLQTWHWLNEDPSRGFVWRRAARSSMSHCQQLIMESHSDYISLTNTHGTQTLSASCIRHYLRSLVKDYIININGSDASIALSLHLVLQSARCSLSPTRIWF